MALPPTMVDSRLFTSSLLVRASPPEASMYQPGRHGVPSAKAGDAQSVPATAKAKRDLSRIRHSRTTEDVADVTCEASERTSLAVGKKGTPRACGSLCHVSAALRPRRDNT